MRVFVTERARLAPRTRCIQKIISSRAYYRKFRFRFRFSIVVHRSFIYVVIPRRKTAAGVTPLTAVSLSSIHEESFYSSLQVPARHAEFIQPVGETGWAGGRGEGGRKWWGQWRWVCRGDGGQARSRDLLYQAPLLPQWKDPHRDLRDHRLRHHCRHL